MYINTESKDVGVKLKVTNNAGNR